MTVDRRPADVPRFNILLFFVVVTTKCFDVLFVCLFVCINVFNPIRPPSTLHPAPHRRTAQPTLTAWLVSVRMTITQSGGTAQSQSHRARCRLMQQLFRVAGLVFRSSSEQRSLRSAHFSRFLTPEPNVQPTDEVGWECDGRLLASTSTLFQRLT